MTGIGSEPAMGRCFIHPWREKTTAYFITALATGYVVKWLKRIFIKQTSTTFFENLSFAIFLVYGDDSKF